MYATGCLNGIGCLHCGKTYKTRVRLDKHMILCEIKSNAKRRHIALEDEEDLVLPSQKQMYKILVELTLKCNKMEEKLEMMSKWVDKKKKKINVVDWLNENVKPEYTFDLLAKKIVITPKEVDLFMTMNNHFIDTLHQVFDTYIYSLRETCAIPLFAFHQKINTIYIYDNIENNGNKENVWTELTREKCIYFLNIIHYKFITAMCEWKKIHEDKINSSDKFCDQYSKSRIRLMDVNFKQDSVLSKVRANIYSNIKQDIKSLIEYEFEF
jgi:hypothetical protein